MSNNLEAKLNNHHIFETKKAKNYSEQGLSTSYL